MMEQKVFCVKKTYYETKSFKTVQAGYRRKFNFNAFPNRNKISKLIKYFEAQGTWEDCMAKDSSSFGPTITQRNVYA